MSSVSKRKLDGDSQVDLAAPEGDQSPADSGSKRPKVERSAKKKGEKSGGKAASERKRLRNRNAENEGPSNRTGQPDKSEGATRLAKRKVALLISFCGTGCSGMQCESVCWIRLVIYALMPDVCQSSTQEHGPSKASYSTLSSRLVRFLKTTPTILRK